MFAYNSRLKGAIPAGIMALLMLFLTAACEDDGYWINPNDDDQEMPVKAPDFNLATAEGDSISLSRLEGNVVVLFFFGHSCPPCRTAAVNIESRLHKPREGRDGFILLGIEASNANRAAINSFRSLTGATFPLLMNGAFATNAYETTIDRLIIVNRSGYIHHKSNIAAGCDLDTVVEKVDLLLQY